MSWRSSRYCPPCTESLVGYAVRLTHEERPNGREKPTTKWNALPWLARRNPWAGVETLIAKALISGPKVDEFRRRDDYLEKATWIGLLVSALLLLAIFLLKSLASI